MRTGGGDRIGLRRDISPYYGTAIKLIIIIASAKMSKERAFFVMKRRRSL